MFKIGECKKRDTDDIRKGGRLIIAIYKSSALQGRLASDWSTDHSLTAKSRKAEHSTGAH